MSLVTALILLAAVVVLFLLSRLVISCNKANLTDWGHPALNFLEGFNRIFCEKYHRLNREVIDLPEQGPAVIVSNHYSGLDPMLLIASSRRPLRFMIAKEQYERFGLQWLFRAVGCIPVDRFGKPEKAMRAAINTLANGEVVVIFPHGKIHLPHHPETKLKSGAAMLAKKTQCSIFPVRLSGMLRQGHVISPVFIRGKALIELYPEIQVLDQSVDEINLAIKACIDN